MKRKTPKKGAAPKKRKLSKQSLAFRRQILGWIAHVEDLISRAPVELKPKDAQLGISFVKKPVGPEDAVSPSKLVRKRTVRRINKKGIP